MGIAAGVLAYSGTVLADEVKVAVAANFKGTIERIGRSSPPRPATASPSVRPPPACSTPRSPTVRRSISSSPADGDPEKLEKEGRGANASPYAIGQLGLWQKGACPLTRPPCATGKGDWPSPMPARQPWCSRHGDPHLISRSIPNSTGC